MTISVKRTSTCAETSKAAQVERGICSDVPIALEFSHAEEARIEGQPEQYRDSKERVIELELMLDLVN